jgi:hypothetical protein
MRQSKSSVPALSVSCITWKHAGDEPHSVCHSLKHDALAPLISIKVCVHQVSAWRRCGCRCFLKADRCILQCWWCAAVAWVTLRHPPRSSPPVRCCTHSARVWRAVRDVLAMGHSSESHDALQHCMLSTARCLRPGCPGLCLIWAIRLGALGLSPESDGNIIPVTTEVTAREPELAWEGAPLVMSVTVCHS